MSSCACDPPQLLRVSDENVSEMTTTAGSGPHVRLRCWECGGKAGYIPIDEPFATPLTATLERAVDTESLEAYLRRAASPGTLAHTVTLATEGVSRGDSPERILSAHLTPSVALDHPDVDMEMFVPGDGE